MGNGPNSPMSVQITPEKSDIPVSNLMEKNTCYSIDGEIET
jgi:hypothetical protein